MESGPIFRALLRNKLGVMLIALQIAFTMTVVINAVFIINERSRLMARPSGLEEANLFYLNSVGFGENFNEAVTIADDLALLRRTPGIIDATVINAIPVSGSGSSTGAQLVQDPTQPSIGVAHYRADEQALNTMNLNLVAGAGFGAADVQWRSDGDPSTASKTVITAALAQELFPDLATNDVVGKSFFVSGRDMLQIVGVVERLQAPWPESTLVERSIIVPEVYVDGYSIYLIRTAPGERDRLMAEVEELLVANNDSRIIRELKSLQETREDSYRVDSAMSTILKIIIVTLVFITSMGIVGLAVFGINKRRKQIGTRRALGATQVQILRYFMLENFFVTGAGVLAGAVFTLALSIMLTTNFNMPTMAWYYIPVGMLLLLLVGQVAVFGPSSSAARTEPALATRSI